MIALQAGACCKDVAIKHIYLHQDVTDPSNHRIVLSLCQAPQGAPEGAVKAARCTSPASHGLI